MAIINTVKPEEATGEIKEIYDALQKTIGMIPAPMQLASASPYIMKTMYQSIGYYSQHPGLSFGVLSTIRYLVAQSLDYAFCTHFNKNFLKLQGMTDKDIDAIVEDPLKAPLEDRERTLVAFVVKAIKTPEDVDAEDMDNLRRQGWKDSDIMDALAHGANMVGASILMKAFKTDVAC
jgi:alkylhydroperoxidase family enzyme